MLIKNDIFDHLFSESHLRDFFQDRQIPSGFPIYDQFMDEGRVVLEFALAGYKPEQLNVAIEDGHLVVSANKDESNGVGGRRIARRAFKQTFIVKNKDLALEDLEPSFENGILRLEIPVKEKQVLSKQIPIKISKQLTA